MNSRIYTGRMLHTRFEPVLHTFRYPVYTFALDLDELPALAAASRWFGYNRIRPFALHDRDYLFPDGRPLRQAADRTAEEAGVPDVARWLLVTTPRFLHYAFNPVSFFHGYDAAGRLRIVLTQVNNTFGESQLYTLTEPQTVGGALFFRTRKTFHVSPFFDRHGEYQFHFGALDERLDIRINLLRRGRVALHARLEGQGAPATPAALRALAFRHPLTVALTMPRIAAQAARLRYQRKLPVFTKPHPDSPGTLRVPVPSRLDRLCMRPVLRMLQALQTGSLRVRLPDGTERRFGTPDGLPTATLEVRDPRFFRRVALYGDVGFGESFMYGEWTTPDLRALLELLIRNLQGIEARLRQSGNWLQTANRLLHHLRPNHVRGSRRNIEAHYDLSNDFFATFLDREMLYSCAIYARPDDTLEDAQRHKVEAMLARAEIRPEHHVLEIGSGWGAFAIEAARRTGCRVTSITVSREQFELATQRVREAGLEDRVQVRLCDYREIEGSYDRIVSIEMLEAVGHDFLPVFFRRCEELLRPGGRAVIQTIVIPHERYEAYRRDCDWIRKHIFPGGHLPSLEVLRDVTGRHTRLITDQVETIGQHYPPTLMAWQERFLQAGERVRALGFDDIFVRKWLYYLNYCAAGFATRYIDTLQIVFRREEQAAPA